MSISSPCSKVCTIDPRSGLCRGCGRTLGEIGQWGSMPEAERRRIMSELPERMRTAGIGQPAGTGERDDSSNRRSVLTLCFAHDLFRKPVTTFRDHALAGTGA